MFALVKVRKIVIGCRFVSFISGEIIESERDSSNIIISYGACFSILLESEW